MIEFKYEPSKLHGNNVHILALPASLLPFGSTSTILGGKVIGASLLLIKLRTFLVVYLFTLLPPSSFLKHGTTLVIFTQVLSRVCSGPSLTMSPPTLRLLRTFFLVCVPLFNAILADRHMAQRFYSFTVVFMATTTYVSLDVAFTSNTLVPGNPPPIFAPFHAHMYMTLCLRSLHSCPASSLIPDVTYRAAQFFCVTFLMAWIDHRH